MSDRVQQATERLRRAKGGESIEIVYGTTNYWSAFARLENDQAILSNVYLAEHAPRPLEAYLAFANMLCVKDAGLDYDVAVAVARAMHKRRMVIPNE